MEGENLEKYLLFKKIKTATREHSKLAIAVTFSIAKSYIIIQAKKEKSLKKEKNLSKQ